MQQRHVLERLVPLALGLAAREIAVPPPRSPAPHDAVIIEFNVLRDKVQAHGLLHLERVAVHVLARRVAGKRLAPPS